MTEVGAIARGLAAPRHAPGLEPPGRDGREGPSRRAPPAGAGEEESRVTPGPGFTCRDGDGKLSLSRSRAPGEGARRCRPQEDRPVDSHDIAVQYRSRGELDTAWNRYIKHSALATAVHPPPNAGDSATIHLRTTWSAAEAVLRATVVQATPAFTIFELAPLDPRAIMALIAMGLEEAAALTPSEGETLAAPMQAPSPPEPAADRSLEFTEAPTDAMTVEVGDAPLPTPASPGPVDASADDSMDGSWSIGDGTFSAVASSLDPPPPPAPTRSNPRIKAVRFSPSFAPPPPPGSRPKAPAPPPAATRPPAPPLTPKADSTSPDDPRFLAGLSGPAGADTEAALPAIARWGDLGESSWRDALLSLLLDRATGVLVLHGFREIRWGYFVDGRPVHYAGDHPHAGEYLSDFLTGDGPLSEAQWTDALRMQKLTGLPAGTYLVRRGALTEKQLQTGLIARAARITERLVAANFGRWSMHHLENVRYVYPYVGVDVVPLLFRVERQAAERLEDDKVVEQMTPFYDHHIIQVDSRLHMLEGLEFREVERVVVDEYLSGGWTIKDLLALRAMNERPLLRLLLVLKALGIIDLAHEEGSKAPRNRVERKLFVALRNITRWPNFEALHCHWTATQYEVEQGHRDTLAEWDISRFESVADARIRDLAAQIRRHADDLYLKLKTRAGRDELRKGRIDPSQRLMASDLLYRQADMEIFKNNLGVARVLFERILELVPATSEGQEYRDKAREGLKNPAVAGAKYPGEGFQAVFKKLDALVAKDD